MSLKTNPSWPSELIGKVVSSLWTKPVSTELVSLLGWINAKLCFFRSLLKWTSCLDVFAVRFVSKVWECWVHFVGREKSKRLRMKFFKKKAQDCRQFSWAVDSQTRGYVFWWTVLSTAATLSYRQCFTWSWSLSECGFAIDRPLGLLTAWGFRANSSRFMNLFLIQIWSFWFSFLEGLHAYIKRGNSPAIVSCN